VIPARWLKTGLFVLSASIAAPPLHADSETAAPVVPGIVIHDAQSGSRNEVHYLNARIEYALSRQIVEALDEGVPLDIVLAIEIVRERAWLWNERIAHLEQRYQISHHALTRQYMVRNVNIGTHHSFPTLEAALSSLGSVSGLPLIDNNLLQQGQPYLVRLRSRVDTSALPVPLRLIALVSPEWRLASEWREWPL
jgi:hypothetical protein